MSSLRPFLTVLLSLLSSLALACASAHGTFAPLGADHPASPEAPELPIADPSAVLSADKVDAPPESARAAPTTGAWVCPMHADVVSEHPGHCPKCGMELVPRASANPEPEGHPHVR